MRHGLLLAGAAVVIGAPWLYIFYGWWTRSTGRAGRSGRAASPGLLQRFSFPSLTSTSPSSFSWGQLRVTPWPRVDQLLPAVALSIFFVPLAFTAHRGFMRGELSLDQTLVQRAPTSLDLLSQAVNVQVWTTLVVLLALGFVLAGRWRQGSLLLLADLSADLAGACLKLLVNREELTTHNVIGHFMLLQNELFPSGHVIRATVTVGLLVAFVFWPHHRLRWPAVASAVAFCGILGITQASVGGHLPLDVLGGYVLAGIWVNLTIVIASLHVPSRHLKALPAGA